MHSAGFDLLVQSFGTGSRRDGLRLLMGAALGGILAGLHDVDTAAKRRRRKRKKKKCKPNCKGKECGDDGCGGSCGKCPGSYDCESCWKGRCDSFPDGWACLDPITGSVGHCSFGFCVDCGYYLQPCCGLDWCLNDPYLHYDFVCRSGFCVSPTP